MNELIFDGNAYTVVSFLGQQGLAKLYFKVDRLKSRLVAKAISYRPSLHEVQTFAAIFFSESQKWFFGSFDFSSVNKKKLDLFSARKATEAVLHQTRLARWKMKQGGLTPNPLRGHYYKKNHRNYGTDLKEKNVLTYPFLVKKMFLAKNCTVT